MSNAFVLIHGGHQGSWFWERVTPLLNRPALAVDLPGRGSRPADLATVGTEASCASVLADIEAAGLERIILAGNSIASATIPAVAAALGDRVDRLVFIGTPIAQEGQTIMQCFTPEIQAQAKERIRSDGGATTTSDDDRRLMNCNDMNDEQAEFTLRRAVPDSQRFFHEPISWKGISRRLPRTYVRLMLDNAVTPSAQDHMITNLRTTGAAIEVIDFDAGHCPMISNPAGLAAILNSL